MADIITTRALQGDTVDKMVWRELAGGAAAVEAVLAANPGLAERGPILPIGLQVLLPLDAAKPAAPATIQLWT